MLLNFMMRLFLLLLVSFWSYGQNCRERFFRENEKPVILDYVREAVRDRYFMGDIGVIFIQESKTGAGTIWDMKMIYDDRFVKTHVPATYAYVNNFLVLFSNDSLKADTGEVLSCISRVILDRLYIYPERTERLMVLRSGPFNDSPPLHPVPRTTDARNPVYTDSDRTARRIIFNREGEVIYSGKNTTIKPD